MAAWVHTQYWNKALFNAYRLYAAREAPKYKGYPNYDCADLSIIFLIQFAASNGLSLTFWDNCQVRYISKATKQFPTTCPSEYKLITYKWSSVADYICAIQRRIGANALFKQNTVHNEIAPEPGDLLLKSDHAALIFAVYKNGDKHPLAGKNIPIFPGDEEARKQKNVTEYFYTDPISPKEGIFIDYLNHRNNDKPKKELIYYASIEKLGDLGYDFSKFNSGVIDNWNDWNGEGDPPR